MLAPTECGICTMQASKSTANHRFVNFGSKPMHRGSDSILFETETLPQDIGNLMRLGCSCGDRNFVPSSTYASTNSASHRRLRDSLLTPKDTMGKMPSTLVKTRKQYTSCDRCRISHLRCDASATTWSSCSRCSRQQRRCTFHVSIMY